PSMIPELGFVFAHVPMIQPPAWRWWDLGDRRRVHDLRSSTSGDTQPMGDQQPVNGANRKGLGPEVLRLSEVGDRDPVPPIVRFENRDVFHDPPVEVHPPPTTGHEYR